METNKYEMRYAELLEKQVGLLYHFTDLQTAWVILSEGRLKPKGEGSFGFNGDAFVVDRGRDWVSLTRNKNLRVTAATGAASRVGEPWGEVCITLDGDKLAHRHRIQPYHDDDGVLTRKDNQAEERIDGETNIEGAVIAVTLYYDLYMRDVVRKWADRPIDQQTRERYVRMDREEAAAFVRWCRQQGWRVDLARGLKPRRAAPAR